MDGWTDRVISTHPIPPTQKGIKTWLERQIFKQIHTYVQTDLHSCIGLPDCPSRCILVSIRECDHINLCQFLKYKITRAIKVVVNFIHHCNTWNSTHGGEGKTSIKRKRKLGGKTSFRNIANSYFFYFSTISCFIAVAKTTQTQSLLTMSMININLYILVIFVE